MMLGFEFYDKIEGKEAAAEFIINFVLCVVAPSDCRKK